MRYGWVLPYGDVRTAAELAAVAEEHAGTGSSCGTAQRPRVPIWVVGAWPRPKSMRRAARLDGWLPAYMPRDGGDRELTPELLREGIDWLRERRAAEGRSMEGYDVVAEGTTPADRAAAAEIVRPWAEAGATWWIDADWSDMDPGRVRGAALERLRAGPPHL